MGHNLAICSINLVNLRLHASNLTQWDETFSENQEATT